MLHHCIRHLASRDGRAEPASATLANALLESSQRPHALGKGGLSLPARHRVASRHSSCVFRQAEAISRVAFEVAVRTVVGGGRPPSLARNSYALIGRRCWLVATPRRGGMGRLTVVVGCDEGPPPEGWDG
jgi:hypothetical protein